MRRLFSSVRAAARTTVFLLPLISLSFTLYPTASSQRVLPISDTTIVFTGETTSFPISETRSRLATGKRLDTFLRGRCRAVRTTLISLLLTPFRSRHLRERFRVLETHSSLMRGFSYNVGNLRNDLRDRCIRLQNALKTEEKPDLDGDALKHITRMLPNDRAEPFDIPQFLENISAVDPFSNLWVALRIPLKLRVSIASGKRSFSNSSRTISVQRGRMTEHPPSRCCP